MTTVLEPDSRPDAGATNASPRPFGSPGPSASTGSWIPPLTTAPPATLTAPPLLLAGEDGREDEEHIVRGID